MRIMVIGASSDPRKFGNKAVRVYVRQGHHVIPVNPNAAVIEGLQAWPDVLSPPGPIDRALIYLPAHKSLPVIARLAQRTDIGELWLNPGADDPEVVAKAAHLGFNVVQACAIMDIE